MTEELARTTAKQLLQNLIHYRPSASHYNADLATVTQALLIAYSHGVDAGKEKYSERT